MNFELQIESKLKLLHVVQKAGVTEQVRQLNREIIDLYVLHAILKKEGRQ
ncbi:MAG: hypothetical protein PHF86_05005 [Candidatus Nanoarchaeia archaeon]|jgi:hypothetical protein|nr:hypothetical protein [Candidatus Nanoarchaeia archaeon]